MTTWWSAYYSDHQMVSLLIRYLHLAALMVGGGTALAIDRVVLGTARTRTDDRRRAAFTAMKGSHRVVVPALAIVTASGILMAAADWTTFVASRLFWIKMISVRLPRDQRHGAGRRRARLREAHRRVDVAPCGARIGSELCCYGC